MQDINQMRFDKSPQDKQAKKKAGGNTTRILAVAVVAACVIIAVLLVLLAVSKKPGNGDGQMAADGNLDGQAQTEVQSETDERGVLEMLRQVMQGSLSVADIHWEKYYPDAIADVIYTAMAEEDMDDFDPMGVTMEILSVSKMEQDAIGTLQDMAWEFLEDIGDVSEEPAFSVEEGYLAFCAFSGEDEMETGIFLILKVDGRYGFYGGYEM